MTLAELRKSSPVLLVFGSYTCPNFRAASETLRKLYPEYKDKIPFYLIYIREAHSTADWAATKNQREDITLQTGQQHGRATGSRHHVRAEVTH